MIFKVSIGLILVLSLEACMGLSFTNILNPWIPDRLIEEDTSKIYFFLYPTKEDTRYREEIVIGNTVTLTKSSYNSSLPVIILIHGFISESLGEFQQEVKNAYLEEDTEANIVTVDWQELATPKSLLPEAFYGFATLNVPVVGRQVSRFIIFLMEQGVLKGPEDVHLVGHSLGAHASGKCGKYFQEATKTTLKRITGLDPAGPVFILKNNAGKLNSDDAEFVDVIHSNAGLLGYYGNLGHVDFWPNGGSTQPNCSILDSAPCDHSASYRFYAKSIREKDIEACLCDQYILTSSCLKPCVDPVIFGEHCPPTIQRAVEVKELGSFGCSLDLVF